MPQQFMENKHALDPNGNAVVRITHLQKNEVLAARTTNTNATGAPVALDPTVKNLEDKANPALSG
jgi:hypothetical protein